MKYAAVEKAIHIYQGNTLAIAKERYRVMAGIEKTTMFVLGYGQLASSIFCYLRPTQPPAVEVLETTYLAERSAHPRSICLKSQPLNYRVPYLCLVVPGRYFLDLTMISSLCSYIRPRREKLGDATPISARSCLVQCSETIMICHIRIRTKLEKDFSRGLVALLCCPMQRREIHEGS